MAHETNLSLIKSITASGILKTPQIYNAFIKIDRKNFVKPEYLAMAYHDTPLPIDAGQTISQPSTVAFMLELLQPKKGEKVLDVGSGSGWTTALLAEIVGFSGEVFGVEIMPDLLQFGRQNLLKVQATNTHIYPAGKTFGLPEKAPFDKILVSAYAKELPKDLIEQLKIDGTMVLPVKNSIVKVVKTSETDYQTNEHPGFVFVPLLDGKEGPKSRPNSI